MNQETIDKVKELLERTKDLNNLLEDVEYTLGELKDGRLTKEYSNTDFRLYVRDCCFDQDTLNASTIDKIIDLLIEEYEVTKADIIADITNCKKQLEEL